MALRRHGRVASRGWCKRRGSQVPLVMLGVLTTDVVDTSVVHQ